MIETIKKNDNPLLKSSVYAGMGFAIATIVSGAVIGLINPKDKEANKFGVYSSLLGAAGGAVLGFLPFASCLPTRIIMAAPRCANKNQNGFL